MDDFPGSVAIAANTTARVHRFTAPLIQRLVDMGVTVYVVAPPGRFGRAIERMGAEFVPWRLHAYSKNPLRAVAEIGMLWRIYRRLRPDLVHHFTVKPNVYGAAAARLAGVPVVFGGVAGLGAAFATGHSSRRVLRFLAMLLYRAAATASDCLTFQSHHDLRALLGAGRLKRKALVIEGGSGVDLAEFRPDSTSAQNRARLRVELGIEHDALVVTMASRLLYDKGVVEFVEAARRVRGQRNACFLLAGEPDAANPGSVRREEISAWADGGSVRYLGYREDISALFGISDVVVHPTYYPEGVPRVLIEAAAMGKPIVSTDIPGVHEVVEDGVNGVLVTPRAVDALAAAIGSLLDDADARTRYGAAGRKKAELGFDQRKVVNQHVHAYRNAWTRAGVRSRGGRKTPRADSLSPARTVLPPMPSPLSVSVIIAARNAEATIPTALDSILSQAYEGPVEVLVADGSDTPATSEIVRKRYPTVRLIPNPDRFIGFGINAALRKTTGQVVVRCDAHATLPPGYIGRAIQTLRLTGAANVGGLQRPVGSTPFERAVATAMTSILGAGDARYRLGGPEGPVDTVYLGVFRREALDAIGGFSVSFVRNEDYELNWRLRRHGEAVWFDPGLAARYQPRATLTALARQYFGYGRWKRVMLRENPKSVRARQIVAPLLVLGLAASAVLALLGAPGAAALPLSYLSVVVVASAAAGIRRRAREALLLPAVFATMHLSWGIGFFFPVATRRETAFRTRGGGGGGGMEAPLPRTGRSMDPTRDRTGPLDRGRSRD